MGDKPWKRTLTVCVDPMAPCRRRRYRWSVPEARQILEELERLDKAGRLGERWRFRDRFPYRNSRIDGLEEKLRRMSEEPSDG